MGVTVLGPDINESFYKFNVNDDKAIRFGMGAVKGVGKGAVETIVKNRKDGKYDDIFDFAKRIDLRLANKKSFENLIFHQQYMPKGKSYRGRALKHVSILIKK